MSQQPKLKRYVLAVTGASGSIYAKILLRALLQSGAIVHLTATATGKLVWQEELKDGGMNHFIETDLSDDEKKNLIIEKERNLGATIASGSFRHDGMIIAPCSMKSLAAVATGLADNLVIRAADVALKERFPLVLLVRETPFSLIHLRNMTQVTEAGAIVLPANPGFYHGDMSFDGLVNFVAGKVLDTLKVDHQLYRRWDGIR